jgi:hypothetical protein
LPPLTITAYILFLQYVLIRLLRKGLLLIAL